MRKGRLLVSVVLLLGAGYLAAQAYSSAIFERELSRTLEDLEARGDLQVQRDGLERGWFVSRGEIQLTALLDDWQLSLPYVARHGLLTTRIEGDLQLQLDGGDDTLFGERLPASPPRWHGEYETLSQTFEGRLDMAPFQVSDEQGEFDFEGLALRLSGEHGDLTLTGSVAPWRLSVDGERLEVGPLQLDSRYRYGDDDFLQRDELQLAYLRLTQANGPEVALQALGYRGEVRLGSDELTLAGRLSLGEMTLAEQPALSGELALGVSRLNADAVRTLSRELREALAARDSQAPLTDREAEALAMALEPQVLATLVDSPRLTLEPLRVESPMFGVEALVEGELVFDGEEIEALSLADLEVAAADNPWLARLDGHFVWRDLPRFVALQLGLPLDTQDLEIRIEAGELTLNGEPLPPLW
ncbi:Uncharacterized conserved protein YdgA, DUF945 family [Franzmannia pantelleriensis]|uniref:Uncharacterized conserved protein YdgA, DUF945 family n=1 Tax=Franzmannia pantelleriensis TaxID=48727 RepID=A0A1G9GND2_9GAMM|nr:DUF945 family protein [Halomonas pantelleriensis]SDL02005.1 Uncharacterized conserved protein YdgA, DUF945 family [Halomonas pantelleriensis]